MTTSNMDSIPTEVVVYDESRHFEDGFNDVYCKCGAHLSKHANRTDATPFEKYRDRTQWFCPILPPQSDMDILRSMMR